MGAAAGGHLVQSGELKALAITSKSRSPLFPAIPTLGESGVDGYEAVGWFGLLAPVNTPQPIIDKLNAEIVRMMRTDELRDRLAALGAEPSTMSPAEFARFINDDVVKWAKLVRERSIPLPGR